MTEPKKPGEPKETAPMEVKARVAALPDQDRRGRGRVKMSQQVRVRPSEPTGNDFDEVHATLNVSRKGIYFPTQRSSYSKGMRLFITFPYSDMHTAINQEYVGEVVRVDSLGEGRYGIAVHLLMTINLGTHETHRKEKT